MRKVIPPGFTLIEVLVVVAIIALLVAILVPSLMAAKDQAMGVVCKTRMRELYNGHVFYAAENRGLFPHFDWWLWDNDPAGTEAMARFYPALYNKTGGVRPTDPRVWVTFGQIYKYIKNKEAYFCPKDSKRRAAGAIGYTVDNTAIHSFSRFIEVNYFAIWQKTGQSFSSGSYPTDGKLDVTDFLSPDKIAPGTLGKAAGLHEGVVCTTTPNRVGLLFEEWQTADEGAKTFTDPGLSDLNDGYSGPLLGNWDHLTTRHRNRGNILYWDGHEDFVDGPKMSSYPSHFDAGSVPANQRYAATVIIGASKY